MVLDSRGAILTGKIMVKAWSKRTDGFCYAGKLQDSKINCVGTYRWPEESSFVGEWKDISSTGLRTTTFTDGSQYDSEFVNDSEKIKREAEEKA